MNQNQYIVIEKSTSRRGRKKSFILPSVRGSCHIVLFSIEASDTLDATYDEVQKMLVGSDM